MARHASPMEQSASPPQQPLTKRDVRRNRIMEKLQSMIDGFSSNQHAHYRAQLQALQVDMTLVLRADPYPNGGSDGTGLLDDGGEEIKTLVEDMRASLPTDEAAQRDFAALAGSWYKQFVHEVNDCVEQRDADLTALHNHYTASITELDRLTQHKLRQAEEEHKALSSTVRQRLIANITKKRQQLLRDKEQLDIADSNALLLHPSHFSINNPGSPPNGLNRKTRHLRHRQGSPNPGDLEQNGGKKKRKAAAMEDNDAGNESPGPSNMRGGQVDTTGGNRSPFREAREKNVYTQYEAPAYSLERIFTEKELAMATDTAKLATWRYFHQPQEQQLQSQQQAEQDSNSIGTNVDEIMENAEDGGDGETVLVAPTTEDPDREPTPAPAAAEMDRTASTHTQVLTRGHARANPLAALNDLAAIATSERAAAAAGGLMGLATSKDPFAPVVPSYHAVTRSEKSGAPAPSGVSAADAEGDFGLMRQSASNRAVGEDGEDAVMSATAAAGAEDAESEEAASTLRRELLDQALQNGNTATSAPYRLPLLETGPALIGKGVERIPGTGFAPVMSFQPSVKPLAAQGMLSGAAGAMREHTHGRNGGVGGEVMSRTTSFGAGSDAGTGNGNGLGGLGESAGNGHGGGPSGRGRGRGRGRGLMV